MTGLEPVREGSRSCVVSKRSTHVVGSSLLALRRLAHQLAELLSFQFERLLVLLWGEKSAAHVLVPFANRALVVKE